MMLQTRRREWLHGLCSHQKVWDRPQHSEERCARASADVRACGRRHRESTAIFIVTASHSGPVFNCTMPILLLYYFWFYYPFFCLASCCPVAWRLASDIILLTSTKPSRHCGAWAPCGAPWCPLLFLFIVFFCCFAMHHCRKLQDNSAWAPDLHDCVVGRWCQPQAQATLLQACAPLPFLQWGGGPVTSPIFICCFCFLLLFCLLGVLNLACFHFQCGKPTSISSQCQFDEVSSCSTNESIETRLGMAPHSSSFLVLIYLF